MVYQDSQPLAHSDMKGNSKFEILLVKIFSLKQKKTNQLLPATKEKIKFRLFKNTATCSFRLNFLEIGNYMFK